MAEPYLTELRAIVAALGSTAGVDHGIVCKHFFSGAAAYSDGTIFMSHSPAGLALKLSEPDRKTVLEAGGKPLRYFPNAPVKKDYVVLSQAFLNDPAAMKDWILRSLNDLA